jgi:hypothetical protein
MKNEAADAAKRQVVNWGLLDVQLRASWWKTPVELRKEVLKLALY